MEVFSKASETSVKIANMEVPVNFNGKPTTAMIASAEMTIDQLKNDVANAKTQLDTLTVQHQEAFDRLTNNLNVATKRLEEAIKLIPEKVAEVAEPTEEVKP